MDRHRLRLKIGEHEFEAEGSASFVEHRFKAFEQLIRPAAAVPPAAAPPPPPPIEEILRRIMRSDRSAVSLTVQAPSTSAATLLLVFGYKVLRAKDAVSGADLTRGLDASRLDVPRVDRILAGIAAAGDIFMTGRKRAKRYGLTDAGVRKARGMAVDLASAATPRSSRT